MRNFGFSIVSPLFVGKPQRYFFTRKLPPAGASGINRSERVRPAPKFRKPCGRAETSASARTCRRPNHKKSPLPARNGLFINRRLTKGRFLFANGQCPYSYHAGCRVCPTRPDECQCGCQMLFRFARDNQHVQRIGPQISRPVGKLQFAFFKRQRVSYEGTKPGKHCLNFLLAGRKFFVFSFFSHRQTIKPAAYRRSVSPNVRTMPEQVSYKVEFLSQPSFSSI